MTTVHDAPAAAAAPWSGRYVDGRVAVEHVVTVRIVGDYLKIISREGTLIESWKLSLVRIDPSFVGLLHVTPRRGSTAALTSEDPGLRAALIQHGILRRRDRTKLLVGFGIGAAALVTAIVLGSSLLADHAAKKVPFEWEQKVADHVRDSFHDDLCKSGKGAAALRRLEKRLTDASPLAVSFDVVVVDWSEVNAFAAPGGVIILTRGLLKHAQSPEELAGVLAHEMQHVAHRHVTSSLIRGSILTAAWQLTVGDFTGLMVVDPTTAFQIANLKFSRDAEREADAGAIEMLQRADIDLGGFAEFFESASSNVDLIDDLELLSTHPSGSDRVEEIRRARDNTIDVSSLRPALSPKEWESLQAMCDSYSGSSRRDLKHQEWR